MKTSRIIAFRTQAYFILIFFMMPAELFSQTDSKTARALSLYSATEIAVYNNKSIQAQEQEVASARSNILFAHSLFLPQVDAKYDYTYKDALLTTTSGANTRKDTLIFSGYKSDNLFDISADEVIYNGGANIATLKQARVKLRVEQETLRAGRLTIEFETKRLFYGILLGYENRRIAKQLVDQAEAHYKEVKAKFDQGTASRFDLLQSKVQISTVIPQLVNAQNNIDVLTAQFKKMLSLDLSEDIVIDGKLEYSLVDIKEGVFLEEAYEKRPEVILKSLGIDMSKWEIEFARAGWLPTISANAGYNFRSNNIANMFDDRHSNWNAGGKVSIALFDGFATKAKVDEASAGYEKAGVEKADAIEQTAVDIKRACLDLVEAKAIIDSQVDSVEEAREAVRLSEERYKNGVGINLDVLDAQVSLAQVEQNLAQAIYDYIIAKAQLDRAMGREFLKEGSYAGK